MGFTLLPVPDLAGVGACIVPAPQWSLPLGKAGNRQLLTHYQHSKGW